MKSIIMIGGGIQEKPAVDQLKALGYRVIVTDRNPDAPAFENADITVNLNARDIQSMIAWVLACKDQYHISGIFTLTSQAPTVAIVANATGLPSLPVSTVMLCDNKLLMKRKFQEMGLPSPRFNEVATPQEAQDTFRRFRGLSPYLKAVDGFGGKGVKQITTVDQIEEAFATISGFSNFPVMIMEEALEGDFIDVQGVFYEEKFYRAGTADSYFSNAIDKYKEYNPVEIFNVSPSQQPDAIVAEAYALLEESSRRMGMTWGPVGGDFILTDKGLEIIEIGPRLHGPNATLKIFPASTGIKPLEFMAQCIAGDEPDPALLKARYDKVALCHVFISEKDFIKEIKYKTDPNELPGLFAWYIYQRPKTRVSKSSSTLSGLASAYVVGSTYEEAMNNLEKIINTFTIV